MSYRDQVTDAFPELDEIEDRELRETVVEIWADALAESDFEHIDQIAWWPPHAELVDHETQVPHVRDVVGCAISIADRLLARRPASDIDRDVVVAGALLHDVSKLYETDRNGVREFDTYIPHPHYSVHLLASAGCSVHLQHVVLAHTPNTNVEPQTIEAEIVKSADELAVAGMLWERADTLSY